jgi:RNA-directed DNA polymerase
MAWKQFYIKKRSGGKRLITSPDEELKEKQKQILEELYKIYYPFKDFYYAFGGLPYKNIKLLAEKHIGKSVIVRLDIKDFFDNIDKEILFEELEKDFEEKKIKNPNILLNKIHKYCFYENQIPQGAITSPFLSNIYLKSFDRIISSITTRGYYNYSRYFDDLTFSLIIK